MSFEHLLEIPNFEEFRLRMSEVQRELEQAERLRAVSPVGGILHCRRAFEILISVFEARLLPHADRGNDEKLADRVCKIQGVYRKQGNLAVGSQWQSLLGRYREWNKYVHPRESATESKCLAELKSFHIFTLKMATVLGRPFKDGEYRPSAPMQAAGDSRQLEGELLKSQAQLKGLRNELELAQRAATEAREQAAKAKWQREEAVAKLESVGENDESKAAAAAARRKVEELEARERELGNQVLDAKSRIEIFQRESIDLKDELRRAKLDSAAAVGTTAALEQQVCELRAELGTSRAESSRAVAEINRLEGIVGTFSEAQRESGLRLKQAEQALKEALSRQASGDDSEDLKEVLRNSEAQVRKLRGEMATRENQLERARRAEEAAREHAEIVKRTLSQVNAELVRANSEREALAQRLMVTERYEHEYPGLSKASTFLRQSLEWPGGAVSPFQSIQSFISLPKDPFADRFEVAVASRSCTLRMIGERGEDRSNELLEAWEVESSSVCRLLDMPARRGSARVVHAADPSKPGFVLFDRPMLPTLSRFGCNGQACSLFKAMLCALALREELEALLTFGVHATWPDADAIAIREGAIILLEPSAVHFGDLGPERFQRFPASMVRSITRDEYDSGVAHVLSSMILRLTGLLPATSDSDARVESRQPGGLRGWPGREFGLLTASELAAALERLRGMENERSLPRDRVGELAGLMHEALHGRSTAALCSNLLACLSRLCVR